MAIVASERTGIQKLVIAMFNAAPGGLYLNEFTGYYEGAAGRSLGNLANILGQSAAFQSLYPSFQTANEFAIAILTPYGLQTNQESLDFVTSKFLTTSKAQIALQVGIAVDSSTSTNAALVNAKAILANKATVSETFSVTNNSQVTTLTALQAAVSQVTAATSSIATQNAANTTAVNSTPGVTIGLTTGNDVVSTNSALVAFKSTDGNDTFSATTSGQFNTGDSINGGAGIDTLNAVTAVDVTSALTSVEIVNLTATTAATVALAGSTGITNINNTGSTANLVVTGTALSTVFGFVGAQANNNTVTYASATGANDSATINLAASAQATTKTTSVLEVENLTITNTGTSSILGLIATDAKSIVVTGTGTVTVGTESGTNFTALTTFNASGFTGTSTVDFQTATNKATVGVTYTGGVGANTVTLQTATLADVLVFNTANASTVNRITAVTNFQAGTSTTSVDKINLAAFALGATTTLGTTTLTLGSGDSVGAFSGTNSIIASANGTNAFVFVDVNKDGNYSAATDMIIQLTGITATTNLNIGDFILA